MHCGLVWAWSFGLEVDCSISIFTLQNRVQHV